MTVNLDKFGHSLRLYANALYMLSGLPSSLGISVHPVPGCASPESVMKHRVVIFKHDLELFHTLKSDICPWFVVFELVYL